MLDPLRRTGPSAKVLSDLDRDQGGLESLLLRQRRCRTAILNTKIEDKE